MNCTIASNIQFSHFATTVCCAAVLSTAAVTPSLAFAAETTRARWPAIQAASQPPTTEPTKKTTLAPLALIAACAASLLAAIRTRLA